MKISEVVSQLQLVLPKFTSLFSSTIGITSITASGGVGTIITSSPHGLTTGQALTVCNVTQNNPITAVSQDGLIFTFTTLNTHDLTYGYDGYETVLLSGFTDGAWNSSFTLTAVPDRNNFSVQSVNSLPTLNTNEYLSEERIDGINGRYSATVVDPTTLTISGSFNDGTYNNGTVKTGVRIAGSASPSRALEQYTAQNANELWMFVTMNDLIASKDRNAYNDAVATFATGEDVRIRLIDGFSLFLVQSVKSEIAATQAVDTMRNDLLLPIMKSLYGVRFTTGLTCGPDFRAIFTGHNFVEYDRATLVYQYNFQFTYDLTNDDSADEDDTRAFNDIDYTHSIGDSDVTDATVIPIKLR